MNQPKFKMGDKLVGIDFKTGVPVRTPFIVKAIKQNFDLSYAYGETTSETFTHELDLEICQEPQKIKRYAVIGSADGMIIEFTSKEAAKKYCSNYPSHAYYRAPSYDTESQGEP